MADTAQIWPAMCEYDAWTYWKPQRTLPPLCWLTLYLRRGRPIKELSLVCIISIIISYQKGSVTSDISSEIFTHLSPTLIAFHGCKIIWDMSCQPPRTAGQHILPRTLTYVFFLKPLHIFPETVFMFLIHLSLIHKLDGLCPGNLENLGPWNKTGIMPNSMTERRGLKGKL